MWRRHQAVQSTVQRWLGHYRTPVGLRKHFLSSSSVGRSSLCTVLFSAGWPSIFSNVNHPSPNRYGDVRLFSSRGGHRRPRIPMMKDLHSVEEVIVTAYEYLNLMSRRNVSAVWARIPQLMTKRPQKQHVSEEISIDDMRLMIERLFDNTVDGIVDCRFREITETTLGMAKIVQILRKRAGGRRKEDAYRIILRELLLNEDNRTANRKLFQFSAEKSIDILHEFDARCLSNLAYAYALIEYVPKFDDGSDLFDHIAMHSAEMKEEFKPQEVSNMVWAYATVGVSHPELFEKIADHIVGLKSLDRFTHPQDVSNTVWAYATAGVNHPQLFEKMANHVMANHIARHDHLRDFKPQDLSNIVWAYATAGAKYPHLFDKMANHIVRLDHLRDFNPQDLSNTVWAYATAQVSHPKMFQQLAKAAVQCKEEFISQDVANILWSYATMGIVDKQLFSSVEPTAAKLIDNYNNQNLGNIAWAFAVADVDAPTLFNDRFINKCLKMRDRFSLEELRQLHQWHLWQTKEKSRTGLPEELQDRCYKEFISEEPRPSKLQDDVVDQLSSIGLDPKEEVLMDSGYRIDALVEVTGKTLGVEVDGPSHFIGKGKSPLAKTILKRRQVPSIDGIELVSVPYWDWDKLGKNQAKKQEYLRQLLGFDN
ncbi:hypothetical protein ACHAWC_004264 [Mediolabrus comicus]